MLGTKIFVLLLLGLLSDAISFDSIEDGYQMSINHDPWWGYDSSGEGFGSSFQYYYPFFDDNDNPGSFHWHVPPIKVPQAPVAPTPPSHPDMATREWPSWLPPIRLIKLPLDEPPAATS